MARFVQEKDHVYAWIADGDANGIIALPRESGPLPAVALSLNNAMRFENGLTALSNVLGITIRLVKFDRAEELVVIEPNVKEDSDAGTD